MAQFFAARSGTPLPADIKAAADTYDQTARQQLSRSSACLQY